MLIVLKKTELGLNSSSPKIGSKEQIILIERPLSRGFDCSSSQDNNKYKYFNLRCHFFVFLRFLEIPSGSSFFLECVPKNKLMRIIFGYHSNFDRAGLLLKSAPFSDFWIDNSLTLSCCFNNFRRCLYGLNFIDEN